ncbi:MAG: hypothetical protein LBC64_07250 [Fibromonadaceae bacterium]|nr:hypothetical protein [Fibromonadaceae bacterium]
MTLKERIDRIIHTGEIELAGEAYKGKYELNNVKSIKDFILGNLRKVYTNLNTGDKITLSGNLLRPECIQRNARRNVCKSKERNERH